MAIRIELKYIEGKLAFGIGLYLFIQKHYSNPQTMSHPCQISIPFISPHMKIK